MRDEGLKLKTNACVALKTRVEGEMNELCRGDGVVAARVFVLL